MEAQTAGQVSTAVDRVEHKHEAIRNAVDNVGSAIDYLDNLLIEIKGEPQAIGGKAAEAPSCLTSLETTLANTPDDLNGKADTLRRITNDIRALIF